MGFTFDEISGTLNGTIHNTEAMDYPLCHSTFGVSSTKTAVEILTTLKSGHAKPPRQGNQFGESVIQGDSTVLTNPSAKMD